MTGRSLLLTGATGILGSWVLAEALERGWRVYALMRDATEESARERLAAVLDLAERSGREHDVCILQGDASQPHLGLSESTRRELRGNLDAVIHCAACTSFSSTQDDEVLRTNIGGVKNVLGFVRETGAALYHVSTAYVAGKRRGRVLETELEHESGFNNTYEESKNRSERLVREAFASGDIRGAVFRPAIIVGAARNGRICQFVNFYSFMQVLDFAVMRKGRGLKDLRLTANPACTKNLAPVDWTAEAMWQIIESEGPSGAIYHLTNPEPPTHGELVQWANTLLDPHGLRIEFAGQAVADQPTFKKAMRGNYEHFEGYLDGEPEFDRTNTDRALAGRVPFPQLDHDHFTRMLEFARTQRWRSIFGKRAKADRTYLENIVPVNGNGRDEQPARGKVAMA